MLYLNLSDKDASLSGLGFSRDKVSLNNFLTAIADYLGSLNLVLV